MSDDKSDSPEMLMTPTQFLPKSDDSLSLGLPSSTKPTLHFFVILKVFENTGQ